MTSSTRENIYGHRARIGYTSPPLTTEIFPYEFYKIVPAGEYKIEHKLLLSAPTSAPK